MRFPRSLDAALVVLIAGCSAYMGWEKFHDNEVLTQILQLSGENRSAQTTLGHREKVVAKLTRDTTWLEGMTAADESRHYSKELAAWIKGLERPGAGSYKLSQVDRNYGPLLHRLNLPPEKTAALRILIADRTQAEFEAIKLSSSSGIVLDDVPDRADILAAGTEDVDDSIHDLLGDADDQTFENYTATVHGREFLIRPFAEHQQAVGAALTDDQIEQLVASTAGQDFGVESGIMRGPGPNVSDDTLKVAANDIGQEQALAFQHYAEVWKARQTMSALADADLIRNYNVIHHVVAH